MGVLHVAFGDDSKVTLHLCTPKVVNVLGGMMKKKPFLSVVDLTLSGYLVLLHVKSTTAPVIHVSCINKLCTWIEEQDCEDLYIMHLLNST